MSKKKKSQVGFPRRAFLRTIGAGVAMGPLLPLLSTSAQEMRAPKRLLMIYTPDGTPAGYGGNPPIDWKPTGSETSFEFHNIHRPLDPHKAEIVVPYGLRLSAAGAGEAHAYGMGGLFTASRVHDPHEGADFDGGNGHRTGWGSGPSVDQVVAEASGDECPYRRAVGEGMPETPYRTLEFGVQCGDPHIVRRMIYRGDKQPIHPETNPVAAFDRLFGAVTGDDTTLERLRNERRSILDVLGNDLDRLRTRVSAEELPKVDAHAEGLRAIERTLDTMPSATCVPPDAPRDGTWFNQRENFPEATRTMIDLTVRSLACDLTRVASIQLSRGFSNIVHEWLGHDTAHHSMSHDQGMDRRPELQEVDRWYSEQFAYLLQSMKDIPEEGGNLLDNTLIVWGRELGNCRHRMEPAPLLLAGSGQGALGTGRFLDFAGQRHAKLLVSVCNAMGLPAVDTFGNIDPGGGALSGLV